MTCILDAYLRLRPCRACAKAVPANFLAIVPLLGLLYTLPAKEAIFGDVCLIFIILKISILWQYCQLDQLFYHSITHPIQSTRKYTHYQQYIK